MVLFSKVVKVVYLKIYYTISNQEYSIKMFLTWIYVVIIAMSLLIVNVAIYNHFGMTYGEYEPIENENYNEEDYLLGSLSDLEQPEFYSDEEHSDSDENIISGDITEENSTTINRIEFPENFNAFPVENEWFMV